MKHLISLAAAALLAGCSGFAHAAPPPVCLPDSPTEVRAGLVGAGVWVYWWCTNTGKLTYEWRAMPAASITPQIAREARAYIAGSNPGFVYTAAPLAGNDPRLVKLHREVMVAIGRDKHRPIVPLVPLVPIVAAPASAPP